MLWGHFLEPRTDVPMVYIAWTKKPEQTLTKVWELILGVSDHVKNSKYAILRARKPTDVAF